MIDYSALNFNFSFCSKEIPNIFSLCGYFWVGLLISYEMGIIKRVKHRLAVAKYSATFDSFTTEQLNNMS